MSTLTRAPESEQPRPAPVVRALTRRPHLARELLLVLGTYAAYTLGRFAAAYHTSSAYGHAGAVWNLERTLRLPSEAAVQQLLLPYPHLVGFANLYYQVGYVVSLAVTLVWLYARHPHHYVWYRRLLALVTGVALIGHIVYPMAPPRLLTGDGIVDTAVVYGHAVYGPVGTGLSNQYAAMPSLHVGWAVVVALGLVLVLRSRWRWLAVLHPVITVLVVVMTGNHYWMDGIVAAALVAACAAYARPWLAQSRRQAAALADPGERDGADAVAGGLAAAP